MCYAMAQKKESLYECQTKYLIRVGLVWFFLQLNFQIVPPQKTNRQNIRFDLCMSQYNFGTMVICEDIMLDHLHKNIIEHGCLI